MKFMNPYFTTKMKIDLLQKWILVHSHLYYDLNSSVVSDMMYDKNCVQLMKMKNNYPLDFKKSEYAYVFSDFDGSSGFGLFNKLHEDHYNSVSRAANWLLTMRDRHESSKELFA